jgi:hypothetical protein
MEDLAKNYTLKKWGMRLKYDITVYIRSPDLPGRIRKCGLLFVLIYIVFASRGCESHSILVRNIELLPPENYLHETFKPTTEQIRPGLKRLTLNRKTDHWQALFVAGTVALVSFLNSKPEKIEESQPVSPNPPTSGPVD